LGVMLDTWPPILPIVLWGDPHCVAHIDTIIAALEYDDRIRQIEPFFRFFKIFFLLRWNKS
jgi:hypothetical protein